MGEGGGETTSLSVAVTILAVAMGVGTVSVGAAQPLSGGRAGRLSQSL